ncbi:hypothetical protein V2S66_22765 [Streptomyces sp. V4-01]|uniref:ClpX-type ZB domain-containing protein n=1 Tax=Actinacidiphila polyblastidii TaxID=3110430 RepID=A0ABU7PI74_9ACTN|nr:hypothetical protein [Streptomyces sp. V4-01]
MGQTACEECGRSEVRVRDLGLRRPLRLCGDCLAHAVAAWRAEDPPSIGDILEDARRGRHGPLRPPPEADEESRRRPPDAEAS